MQIHDERYIYEIRIYTTSFLFGAGRYCSWLGLAFSCAFKTDRLGSVDDCILKRREMIFLVVSLYDPVYDIYMYMTI